MSFDTRNAIARFIGWFWQDTRERVSVPLGFSKPLPLTRQNPYPWGGYGFSRVRVRVALGYPRVTHYNPYPQTTWQLVVPSAMSSWAGNTILQVVVHSTMSLLWAGVDPYTNMRGFCIDLGAINMILQVVAPFTMILTL